ncbi:MAG: DUF373 family protein [Candidatus Diapherotrites archaeon]
MPKHEAVLVLSVDRDNDLGRKANVQGPVIGRKNVLNAAAKLAVADPGDSDSNCLFGSIKKFDEVKGHYPKVELAAVTGVGKTSFESDKRLNEQLDEVLSSFDADGFVLVTDGAEDDQVIPLLQARAPIISKETIIVKQAKEMEGAYYALREALKDPFLARIAFGLPGIVLLLYGLMVFFGIEAQFIQGLLLVVGIYLLLKGFGVEEKIVAAARDLTTTVSVQRTSFPFYIACLFFLVFAAITAYNSYAFYPIENLFLRIVVSLQTTYFLLVITAVSFIIGKAIDAIHFKKMFQLRKYFLSVISVLLLWFILDSGTLVITKEADINFFLLSILLSFVILLVAYKASTVFDVRRRVTKLLIGLPVFSKEGKYIGKVEDIDAKDKAIEFKDLKGKTKTKVNKNDFTLRHGRIILTAATAK